MNATVLMDVFEPQRRLADGLCGLIDVKSLRLPTDLSEINSVDELHHQIVRSVVLTGVECSDDVGMVQAAQRDHLAFKPFDRDPVRQAFGLQEFDGSLGTGGVMLGAKNGSHSALAERFGQQVIPDAFVQRSDAGRRSVIRLAQVCGGDIVNQLLPLGIFRGSVELLTNELIDGCIVAIKLFETRLTIRARLDVVRDRFQSIRFQMPEEKPGQ